jgi:hypothetical protein
MYSYQTSFNSLLNCYCCCTRISDPAGSVPGSRIPKKSTRISDPGWDPGKIQIFRNVPRSRISGEKNLSGQGSWKNMKWRGPKDKTFVFWDFSIWCIKKSYGRKSDFFLKLPGTLYSWSVPKKWFYSFDCFTKVVGNVKIQPLTSFEKNQRKNKENMTYWLSSS